MSANDWDSRVGQIRSAVDFGKTANDYAQYRRGFPSKFYNEITIRGYLNNCVRILDVGTGAGVLARELASRGLDVTGLDRSDELMQQAKRLDQSLGLSIQYKQGVAEQLPFDANQFDLVTAGQCWHWFDGIAAATEVHRVLKLHGRIIIAHFDWLPIGRNIVRQTEELIELFNPAWHLGRRNGFYPQWLEQLKLTGFDDIESFSFDIDEPFTQEAWRGRIRASAGVGSSLPIDTVEQFDRQLARLLHEQAGDQDLLIPHRLWVVTSTKPTD